MSLEPPPRFLFSAVTRLFGDRFWSEWLGAVEAAWTEATAAGAELTPTSWWRSAQANARVGGNEYSQHLLGLAIDLVAEDKPAATAAFERMGFIVIDEGDHLHVQTLPAGWLRRMFGA